MMKKLVYILIIAIALVLVYFEQYWKFLLLPLFVVLISLGRKEERWYNPFFLLIVSLISFLLYSYDMAPVLLQELEPSTIILIILCFTAILMGFVCVKKVDVTPIKSNGYIENFWVIFIIGLIPTVLSYILYGNILDMTGEDMLDTKAKYSIPMIGQLAYFLPASIIVACKKNSTPLILLSLGISILAALMTVTKTAMLMALIFFIIGLSHFHPDILNSRCSKFVKKYAIIWIVILISYMFMYNNSIRHDASSTSSMEYVERSGSRIISSTTEFGEGMFLNYLYFCSPWGNLEYNIDHNPNRGYGSNTFAQFGKKLGVNVNTIEKIQPTFLNTHSFITDFYLDFGYVGAIIASFFLGLIIYFFYWKFGKSDDSLFLAHYAVISFATIMLFFSNHFTNGYLLNYLITFGGYYWVFHKFKLKQ